MTMLILLGALTMLVWPLGFWFPWAVVATTLLAAASGGAMLALWDDRHPLTWGGRLWWARALGCRWFGIHEPWEDEDCVHCHYRGPRVVAYEKRRDELLAEMRRALRQDGAA